jgi:ketopantoate reductase
MAGASLRPYSCLQCSGWGLSFHGPPEDVRFIARGAHLAALRDKGLTLNSATGAQKVSR